MRVKRVWKEQTDTGNPDKHVWVAEITESSGSIFRPTTNIVQLRLLDVKGTKEWIREDGLEFNRYDAQRLNRLIRFMAHTREIEIELNE